MKKELLDFHKNECNEAIDKYGNDLLNYVQAYKEHKEALPTINKKLAFIGEASVDIPNLGDRSDASIRYEFIKSINLLTDNLTHDNKDLYSDIIEYFKELSKILSNIIRTKDVLNEYRFLARTPANIIDGILFAYSKEAVAHLLNGNLLNLGKNLSSIKVVESPPDTIRTTPDFGASNKLLMLIAKEDYPEEYAKLQRGDYSMRKFIRIMRKYTYNPDRNPRGIRWLLYKEGYDYLYKWYYKSAQAKNARWYIFKPSRFCNINMPKAEFLKKATCNDDIINTHLLGLVPKLKYLVDYDPTIVHKFRK